MSETLYRKYRSRGLDEVVGQSQVTDLLRRALEQGRIAHAYLLTGPHGVGKTSVARIMAHAINDLEYSADSNHLDIIEIDAASNNGVDDIRELRERVHVAPTSAKRKVYIIDEVHMLSKPAFNALLKTLEEPPEHVVFILATTDADKLPATIISRVQRFNFRTIALADAAAHLRTLAESEGITISDEALQRIAEYGDGSFRDSIGLLDQLRVVSDAEHEITVDDVDAARGLGGRASIDQLLEAVRNSDRTTIAQLIDQLERSGAQASLVVAQMVRMLQRGLGDTPRDIMLLDNLLDVPSSSHPYLKLLTVLLRHTTPDRDLAPPKPTKQPTPSVQSQPDATPQPSQLAPKPAAAPKPVAEPKPESTQATLVTTDLTDFSWPVFVDTAKSHSAAVYALLQKAGGNAENGHIRIYAGTKFAAKQLETSKQRAILSTVATQLGFDPDAIVITPDKKPITDSQSAAVAAIMGGGEEVTIDDGN